MIRSEPITEFPYDLIPKLSEYAQMELSIAGDLADYVVEKSEQARVIWNDDKPLCVCGVVRPTLLGNARFWFMLCTGMTISDLKGIRRQRVELLELYPRVETVIDRSYSHGERFATWFGFQPLKDELVMYEKVYRTYEARR